MPCTSRRRHRPTFVGLTVTLGAAAFVGSSLTGCTARLSGPQEAASDASDPEPLTYSPTRLVRLTHAQWQRAAGDLLGTSSASRHALTFRRDPTTKAFDNDRSDLVVTAGLHREYAAAAEALAAEAVPDRAALARLVPSPRGGFEEGARAFIAGFGQRAYRRPLEEGELERYLELLRSSSVQGTGQSRAGDPLVSGIRSVIATMLQSPFFLYRPETSGSRLGAFEAATKLSFVLAGTAPDEDLLDAARRGVLERPSELRVQADRLLARGLEEGGPMDDFHNQYLALFTYGVVEKNATRVPEWTPDIARSLPRETLAFTRALIGRGGTFADLLTEPATFVDAKLAPLYGLHPGRYGEDMVETPLDRARRGGWLTQLGFLATNAGFSDVGTGIALRGAFIARHLLCRELVPPIEASFGGADASSGSARDRLDALTAAPACVGCHHRLLNPLGGAFERYDTLGRWREVDDWGLPIVTSGELEIDGARSTFADALDLARLLARSDEVRTCYARGMISYLLARTLNDRDEATVSAASRALASQSVRSWLLDFVTSDVFLGGGP